MCMMLLRLFQHLVMCLVYHSRYLYLQWTLDFAHYIWNLFSRQTLHVDDYRCLSKLTLSSALGNMGILHNTTQIKSNVPANYRIYFPSSTLTFNLITGFSFILHWG